MFNKFQKFVHTIASMLDKLAGLSIVLAMLLVVVNVILRILFKSPILGTYEFTGFLTALIVAFGISSCLVSNSHIAIDFIVEKFNIKIQRFFNITINFIIFIFMSIFTYKMFTYATTLLSKNELSPTTQTPFYIFIFIITFCFIILSLISLLKTITFIKEVKA